jgi:hypothetical protein
MMLAHRRAHSADEQKSMYVRTLATVCCPAFPTLRTYPGKFFMRNPIVSGKVRDGR